MKKIIPGIIILLNCLTLLGQSDIHYQTYNYNNSTSVKNNSERDIGIYLGFGVDLLYPDFSEYTSVIGEYNTNFLNDSYEGTYNWEIGGSFNKCYLGINLGWRNHQSNDYHVSLSQEYNTRQYGINLGYNLVSSKHILLTPRIALKWNRYRILNYSNERKISLNEYVKDRDLDIRMNQMTGQIGLNFAYKLFLDKYIKSDYLGIGIYGGYMFKITDEPWIYSTRNRLISDNSINFENYYWGLLFSFNLEKL